MRRGVLFCLVIFLSQPVYTGEDADSASTGNARLRVTSTPSGAPVVLNNVNIGSTPFFSDSLHSGRYVIRVLDPRLERWSAAVHVDTINLVAGEEEVVECTFQESMTIASEPFDAAILAGDSVVGHTPMVMPAMSGPLSLKLSKPGYESASIMVDQSIKGTLMVPLSSTTAQNDGMVLKSAVTTSTTTLGIYYTGLATVVASVVAAHSRMKADNVYAEYQLTQNPALLNETHRLDANAAIALIVAEIHLAVFTYLILSD